MHRGLVYEVYSHVVVCIALERKPLPVKEREPTVGVAFSLKPRRKSSVQAPFAGPVLLGTATA
jgi:hypothetical protein